MGSCISKFGTFITIWAVSLCFCIYVFSLVKKNLSHILYHHFLKLQHGPSRGNMYIYNIFKFRMYTANKYCIQCYFQFVLFCLSGLENSFDRLKLCFKKKDTLRHWNSHMNTFSVSQLYVFSVLRFLQGTNYPDCSLHTI